MYRILKKMLTCIGDLQSSADSVKQVYSVILLQFLNGKADCVMCKTSAALVELYPFSHTVRNIIMCRIVITIPLYKNTYHFCKIILFPLSEIKRYNVNKHRKDGIFRSE